MKARCPEHQIMGSGILTGYRWIITAHGYASVVRSVSDLVFGTVYWLSDEDERRLDLCEGVQDGSYRKARLAVETEHGSITCLVYLAPSEVEGSPREEYLERIRYGIRDARLPSLYVERYLSGIVA